MVVQTSRRRNTEYHFVMHTDWQGYLKMLEVRGDSKVRVTYDGGVLELMTTSRDHERVNSLLGRLLEALLDELDMAFITGGSPTMHDELLDKGLEPDDCFWIQHVTECLELDVESKLPPDLAVEVDVSRSVLSRLRIYAALGIREVWRWRKGHVEVYGLKPDGTYDRVLQSPTIPGLPLHVLREFLAMRHTQPTSTILRRFRSWVRAHRQQLVPGNRPA